MDFSNTSSRLCLKIRFFDFDSSSFQFVEEHCTFRTLFSLNVVYLSLLTETSLYFISQSESIPFSSMSPLSTV